MYLPHIKHTENATRQMLSVFGGYNHNTVISEGEFYEMTNMTSNLYPVLSSRPSRKGYTNQAESVIWVGDKRISLQPPHVVIGDETDTMIDLGLQSGVEHKAVVSGAYLVIFPEAVFVNLMTTEYGTLSQEKNLLETENYETIVRVENCNEQGDPIEIWGSFECRTEDFEPSNFDVSYSELINTCWYSVKEKQIYQYQSKVNDPSAMTDFDFVSLDDAYIRLEVQVMYPEMSITDAVENGWMAGIKDNDYILMTDFPEAVAFLNGKHIVKKADVDKRIIVIKGYTGQKEAIEMPLNPYDEKAGGYVNINPMPSVSFVIPPLDFITSCENRLWGCRYGTAHNGEFVNEIYCTALGDIHRWYNLNDDKNSHADNSWIASIGHMGPFTGAVSYGGRPYFFKQDRIYAVYGDTATTFGYTELTERGVQAGCEASLCVLDGVLYYKALDGIVAFDGSSTSLISQALGAVKYGDAVGGGADGKYYVSMVERSSGLPSLFAFDARRGLWHREDGLTVSYFTNDHHGDLWGISGDTLYCFGERDNSEVIPWCVESGIIGLDDPDKKYISRLSLRLSLDVGAFVKVSIQYDSMGDFEPVLYYEGVYLQTLTLPIMPRRCDHMRIRMEGVGGVRIYSLTKTIEGGSDT